MSSPVGSSRNHHRCSDLCWQQATQSNQLVTDHWWMVTREGAMARILGLGHVGIFVRDLDRMLAFYRDFLGLTLTKQDWRWGIVFLSADPVAVDHEIALVRGRPADDDPHLIHQISLLVDSLESLRDDHRRLVAGGYQIDQV